MNEDQYYRIIGAFWRALNHSNKHIKLHICADSKTVVIEDSISKNKPDFYAYIDDHTSRKDIDNIIYRLYRHLED